MFQKRKTLALRYDDAVETLGGDESRLRHLIAYGVVVQNGNTLELGDAYLRFFEEVLEVNEEISVHLVKTYVDSLNLKIDTCLAAGSNRRPQLLRDIRHTLRSISTATRRNVIDLKRNVEDTYKQEPDFKIKTLRLKAFDDKCRLIGQLIRQTELVTDRQATFFTVTTDTALRQTVDETQAALNASAHGLIAIKAQIIEYLNRIEYQSRIVRKVRQLKYLRDRFMAEQSTNVLKVASEMKDVWVERGSGYTTKVSLDFLRNDDSALAVLGDVRRRLNRKTIIKSKQAGKIAPQYLNEMKETTRTINHKELIDSFTAQSADLFTYVWNYNFDTDTDEEQRLVIFLQLASQYPDKLRYTCDTATKNKYEYPLIFPK